jgi:hypothetical protein
VASKKKGTHLGELKKFQRIWYFSLHLQGIHQTKGVLKTPQSVPVSNSLPYPQLSLTHNKYYFMEELRKEGKAFQAKEWALN